MGEILGERIQRYRRLADAAHAAARSASCTEVSNAFVAVAATWEILIGELLQAAPVETTPSDTVGRLIGPPEHSVRAK